MKITISLSAIKKTLFAFFHRFHVLIFVIIVLGGLTLVVFLLNGVIVKSGDTSGYTPPGTSTSFDQATIDKIRELRTRDQAEEQLDLSNGRTNPFVE